jgi:hypothetical protein
MLHSLASRLNVTPPAPAIVSKYWRDACGLALLLGGVIASWVAAQRMGVDFATLHGMGLAIVDGVDVYDPVRFTAEFKTRYDLGAPPGMFYPPATGIVMAPLALFPYAIAKSLWLALLIASVVFGVRAVVRVAAPHAARSSWMIAAGLILLSAATRWGMTPLQGAPLIFGLLCVFVAAQHADRPKLAAGIAGLVTVFKITLALPFLGLLLLHRRFRSIVLCCVAWVALNALGFWRMGSGAFASYQQGMKNVEAMNDINSPDPWFIRSIPRLDWTYLYFGVTRHLAFSRLACLFTAAAVGLFVLTLALRRRSPISLTHTTAFLAVWVCLGTLAVYHHQYDLVLFFTPVLLALFDASFPRRPRWALALLAPLLAMMCLLPIAKLGTLLQRAFGEGAFVLLNLSFPIAVTLALIGSLRLLLSACKPH